VIDSNGEIGGPERAIQRWLVRQTRQGVPELVLVSLLREAADDIEERGYVSRQSGQVMKER
jgi:hypothetical protein